MQAWRGLQGLAFEQKTKGGNLKRQICALKNPPPSCLLDLVVGRLAGTGQPHSRPCSNGCYSNLCLCSRTPPARGVTRARGGAGARATGRNFRMVFIGLSGSRARTSAPLKKAMSPGAVRAKAKGLAPPRSTGSLDSQTATPPARVALTSRVAATSPEGVKNP